MAIFFKSRFFFSMGKFERPHFERRRMRFQLTPLKTSSCDQPELIIHEHEILGVLESDRQSLY